MLLAFPLSSSVFLGNCTPMVTPKVIYMRPLSFKFTQAPDPGGINSKLGKSQSLSRSHSPRPQAKGASLKEHAKSCIQDNFPIPSFRRGLMAATTWLFFLLILYAGASENPMFLLIFFSIYIVIYARYVNFGKCRTMQRKKNPPQFYYREKVFLPPPVYFLPLFFLYRNFNTTC